MAEFKAVVSFYGYIIIEAETQKEAANLVRNMTLPQLVEKANIYNGEVERVKNV